MCELQCPQWCASLHDEALVEDRRHESEIRPVAVITRVTNDAPAAEEIHAALFQFLNEDETWVGIEHLQISPESARRLIRALTALLAKEGEADDSHTEWDCPAGTG